MLGKKVLAFVLCSMFLVAFAQDQSRQESLPNSVSSFTSSLTESELVIAVFNELAHYFDATVKFCIALNAFEQNHKVEIPEITCKYCPQRALPCDELINKIKAKAMEKAVCDKTSVAEAVRKKMLDIYQEITNLLSIGNIDNLRKFMAKIAQEKAIPCEGCQKVEWVARGVH